MKRSNRLVLLIGVFLAIVAFIGILVLQSPSGGDQGTNEPPQELPTVVAKADIPLGSRVQANQVEVKNLAVTARESGALEDPSQAVGKIKRQSVTKGAQITTTTFTSPGNVLNVEVPPGKRAMSVQVDQVSGVGTVIKTGDYVDMVVGFTGDKFPVITLNQADDSFTVVSGINSTSVKVLLQGLQVLGTLLPAPEQTQGQEGAQSSAPPTEEGTTLNNQQQIVILAVDAQQSEIIKFAQMDGSMTLTLRSADDFLDPTTGQPLPDGPLPDTTTGVILKGLVDQGVLPPELVETVLPAQGNTP